MGGPAFRAGLLALLLVAGSTVVRGDTALPRLVLVFDASGSMWGEVEGRPKIAVARQVVRQLVADWDPRVELGLTVYGHRREGDCADIERVLPLGPTDPSRVVAALDAIEPRGKTPIAASLRLAAEELRYLDDPATLILVTDGRETCGVDPCDVARELEERGVAFTAHVVGFDIRQEHREELRCLAETTGGMYLAAGDARSLRDALRAAVREATLAEDEDGGVWLAAVLAAGRDPLRRPLRWRVVDPRDGRLVHREEAPTLFLPLAAGRYRVEAELEGVVASAEFALADGESASQVVSLEAGQLELVATERALDEPAADDISWQVRRVDLGADPFVRRARAGKVRFTLPAGRYRVTARREDADLTREITLRAGEVRRERLRFGSGRLALRAVLSPGLMPVDEPVGWEVRTAPAPDGRMVAMEQKPTTLLSLEDGRYWVTARYGETEVGRWIDVQSGTTRTHTLDLGAGTIRVFGSLPAPGGPIHAPIAWEVVSARGEMVARVERPTHSFVLPAGRYEVSGTFEDARASRAVVVRPGGSDAVGLVFPPRTSAAAPSEEP